MSSSLASLLVQKTRAAFYDAAIEIATALGLPVTTWSAGDPTRSLYHVLAAALSEFETVVALFVASGFLDYATGAWLILLAEQVFGVTATPASYATAVDYVLTNTQGGVYDFDPGDVTVKSDAGKTYRNTTGGHLASGPGTTLTITIVADEAGSDSSAGAGEITELVTNYLGVTGNNPTALAGTDAESESSIRSRCRAKIASLSPNGAADAYSYVARNPDLTSTTGITRVRVLPDSDTGDVTVYLAGPSGAVSSDDRDSAEAAVLLWATPLCITPTVASANSATISITYHVWIYRGVNLESAAIEAGIEAALETLFATRPIGGDILTGDTTGSMYQSLIIAAIRGAYPDHIFRVTVSSPAGDTALAIDDVAVLGAVTPTITLVDDP